VHILASILMSSIVKPSGTDKTFLFLRNKYISMHPENIISHIYSDFKSLKKKFCEITHETQKTNMGNAKKLTGETQKSRIFFGYGFFVK
ncbi:MAG: hypothetical protein K2H28_03050, partial [Ruminococcus sp.]|nr:hypothetical protein [Ruminococcus sp.]